MVQIGKRCRAGFLDPGSIEDGDIVEILSVDVVPKEETKFKKRDRTILTVKLKGNEYRCGINNTTNDRLIYRLIDRVRVFYSYLVLALNMCFATLLPWSP